MTEEDWETSPDPRPMLSWVEARGLATPRKRGFLLTAAGLAAPHGEWARQVTEECKPPARLADLLREVFGNPFRRVRDISARLHARFRALPRERRPPGLLFAREWVGWQGGLPLQMALAIEDDYAWERLPILGDALEEAGCDDEAFLGHLRSPGPHVRGCWALDLILGKE